jgi:hypothetical protein
MHRLTPTDEFDKYILTTTSDHIVYDFNQFAEALVRDLSADMSSECAEDVAMWLIEDELLPANPDGGESARFKLGATVFWWSAVGALESRPWPLVGGEV